MLRLIYLLGVHVKYFLLYFLIKFRFIKTPGPKILRSFFEEAGGSFIKFGQFLSLRVDAMPKEYMIELLGLFDNVKPFSYRDVKEIFIRELGATPDKIFYDFQKEPFASASFGQVHAAKLTSNHIVAVKVMRPGLEEKVTVDFFIIDLLAFLGDLFFKIEALPWKEFASEFKKWTKKELDYRVEAENTERMRKSILDNPSVVIPKVYEHYSTKRILVEDYIEGYPLSRVLLGLKDGRLTPEKLLKLGVDITKTPRILVAELFREYFFEGIFHADPHPGNILLLRDDKIALIDFGIVGDSIVYHKASFVHTVKAWGEMDFKKATYHFANVVGDNLRDMIGSALPASVSQEHVDGFMGLLSNHFSESVKKIVEGNRKNLEIMKKDYTIVILEIVNAAKKYRIKLPKEMIIFLRTLSIAGYLAKELDYEFKLTDETKKFFEKHPEDTILKEWDKYSPYKRISHERAIEQLNSWLSYLVEIDPDLYQLVKHHISKYNVG